MQKLLRRRVRSAGKVRGEMQASRRFAGEDCGARWGADRLRAISCGEAHAIAGELIEVRRVVFLAPVTSEIVDSKIVRENEDYVRPRGEGGCCCEPHTDQESQKTLSHTRN